MTAFRTAGALLAATLVWIVRAADPAADPLIVSARSGEAAAQLLLAQEFMLGRNGRAKSPVLAYYWYRQAAKNGSPAGQYNLAMCCLRGWGTSVRPAAAFRFFEQAMRGGVDRAALRCAVMLHDGVAAAPDDPEGDLPEVKPDPDRAVAILRRLRLKGDREAEVTLAGFLARQSDRHAAELRQLLEQHASRPDPDPEMLIMYAAFLRAGAGGAGDPQRAAGLLERAAAAGSAEAMAQLAEILHQGFGIPADHARADRLRDAALQKKSPRAMVDRGVEHLAGVRKNHDPARAFALFQQAAQQNYPPALRHLGHCYAAGIGTAPDPEQAFRCYYEAARRDDAPAQFRLGECFRHGRGVDADPVAAFHWYQRAARNGDPDAMRETGTALLTGRGVEPNRELALEWLRKAAAAGDRAAARALGISDAAPF